MNFVPIEKELISASLTATGQRLQLRPDRTEPDMFLSPFGTYAVWSNETSPATCSDPDENNVCSSDATSINFLYVYPFVECDLEFSCSSIKGRRLNFDS